MRQRIERKLRKRLRNLRRHDGARDLARNVERLERSGLPFSDSLHKIVFDASLDWHIRAEIAKILMLADNRVPLQLVAQFFTLRDKLELWQTALTIESLSDVRCVASLIPALHDENPDRRHAAARALGWIGQSGGPAVTALVDALQDTSQPTAVREEAAESLAYLNSNRAIPALISALHDPAVQVRFWSVFALGSIRSRKSRRIDPRVIPAIESMLDDHETPTGWWPVSKEARDMLDGLNSDS